jgi:hypothetical protein
MTNRVNVEREISLNGERYPLGGDGKVRTIVTSQYPRKLVLGDVDKDSNPRTSVIVWDDWSGGLGQYSTNGKEGMDRFYVSEIETRYKGHLTLPILEVSASYEAVSGTIDEITTLGSLIVVSQDNDAYVYTPSTNSWGGKAHDFPAQVTDSLNFIFGTTEYVAFATTGGYTYSSNGTAYTNKTIDTLHMAFWDYRLWGIGNTGQLWYSSTIGVQVNDAKLPLPTGYVNRLFVGPDATGEEILYAATEVGLYAHDAANARFVRTNVVFPQNSEAGKGAATWNGEIYICAGGLVVFRYDPRSGTIRSVGLDRDGGLPATESEGDIVKLVPTHNTLMGVTSNDTIKSVYDYNGRGWHHLMRDNDGITGLHVSDAGGFYRAYYEQPFEQVLRYIPLSIGFINPDVVTRNYRNKGPANDPLSLTTPWFHAGQNDIDKTAIRIRVECTDMSTSSSGEHATISFGLNYSTDFSSSTLFINSDGVSVATFPTLTNNNRESGSDFRAIRFKIVLERGSTVTNTPNVKSLSLEWRRKLVARYGFEFTLDRSDSYGGKTPKEMKANLITAIETGTQVEFTFVDDDGNTQNYYVDVTNMEDVEDTGHGEIGQTRIAVIEA